MHPIGLIYFGLEVVPIWVLWGHCMYYLALSPKPWLGTWTLRVAVPGDGFVDKDEYAAVSLAYPGVCQDA